jgi:hypothetical protein
MGTGREWCGDRDGVVERDDEEYIVRFDQSEQRVRYFRSRDANHRTHQLDHL